MSIFAQCGYGRGEKIERAINEVLIDGVIMSPRDERRNRLESTIAQWRQNNPNLNVLFDPQFYITIVNNHRANYLEEYDYYSNNPTLGRGDFSASRIQRYVQNCITYQYDILGRALSYLVSPTVYFDGFRDNWSQIALDFGLESLDYHGSLANPMPLFITLVISENAFNDMDAMREYLDALTSLEVHGFYIILQRNNNALRNDLNPDLFGKFMYFCYILSIINEYTILVGYSDWHSFLLEAAGVKFAACGWYQNLRHFNINRFLPSTGGRRPHRRYSSIPLLSSPLIFPELVDIFQANLLSNVLSGSDYDAILSNDPAVGEQDWSDEISCLSHWFSLKSLSERISSIESIPDRIQEAANLIENARTNFNVLAAAGITFDPSTGPLFIANWLDALQEFRQNAGI
jgi:hypothetical protein